MSLPDQFSYHFYPVGQGLFSTGSIRRDGEDKSRFLWVYDCGSSTSDSLVENGIQLLTRFAGDRKRIDLLTLSHFDDDHINGVVRLLKQFRIGTLMLPYMSLAQRLVLAFEARSGGADDPLTDFYLNPVAFLLALEGPGVARILFVLPSGDEGPAYPPTQPAPQGPGPDDEPRIAFNQGKPSDADDADAAVQATSIVFLAPGSPITVASCAWEFIPYNDDPETAIAEEFIAKVATERAKLLSATSGAVRQKSLEELKSVYDDHFGAGSKERNVISLLLYSGPIYSTWRTSWITEGVSLSRTGTLRWPLPGMHAPGLHEPTEGPHRPRCSVLYSGDGYLNTEKRRQLLSNFLKAPRMRRIGVFQVMHHGAKANWRQGTAEAIAPLFSVFSSDPERKGWNHPHPPVLRDFWLYGAVQVDKDADFTAYGYLSER